jgi:hypothetical protein
MSGFVFPGTDYGHTKSTLTLTKMGQGHQSSGGPCKEKETRGGVIRNEMDKKSLAVAKRHGGLP